jgi:diguanylate cyclase (GGDEF)-like protein/PAS domain S-box-containing protein
MENINYKEIADNSRNGICVLDLERTIVYWNHGAERISGYTAAEVMGRSCYNNLLVHVDSEGRAMCGGDSCPATWSMRQDEPCDMEIYLLHREGYRVPILSRTKPLKDSNGVTTGAVEIFNENSRELAALERVKELEKLSLLDELTGLGNRMHAEMHLQARLDQLARYRWPFGLLFFDIDLFKRVNDTYGHDAGDRVLKVVARTAQAGVRSFDVVSRWGGEEFTAIVENTDGQVLLTVAEKLRRLVENTPLLLGGDIVVTTVSIGATLGVPHDSIESLVKRADELMYESKERGRNKVTLG